MDDFDIAGICAHPDDAEMVMGGTLALEAGRGRRVALLDLTRTCLLFSIAAKLLVR